VHHCQIEWPEIFVEGSILEVAIDVEEEGIFNVLRWFDVRNKKEFA